MQIGMELSLLAKQSNLRNCFLCEKAISISRQPFVLFKKAFRLHLLAYVMLPNHFPQH
jgi:hypothetical protein